MIANIYARWLSWFSLPSGRRHLPDSPFRVVLQSLTVNILNLMIKSRSKKIASALAVGSLNLAALGAELPVNQDGWITFTNGDVKESGTGNKLNVATPNPTGAFQYTRLALFGFDTSAVDLDNVQNVVFSATLSDDVIPNYAGVTLRFHLVANSLADKFDETTLTDGNAPGVAVGNIASRTQITGAIIGDVTLSDSPASEEISVAFSASAVADLVNDDNGFVTVIVENLDPNNAGYNNDTGLGFQSKESGNGATLSTSSDFLSSTPAVQDAYVDFGDPEPADGGTGNRLSIATPDPSNITGFSRVAYFGFDISEVNFSGVGAATFRAQLADDIIGYEGATVRFYLLNNDFEDSFDETTLIDTNAPGLTVGDLMAEQQIEGTILGDVVIRPASNPLVGVNFPAEAFANISDDTNGFLTIVAEVRTPSNAGYNTFNGIGFTSKESGNPATLLFGRTIIESGNYRDYISSFGLTGASAEPDTDFDGDGQSNALEYALGAWNPTLASSSAVLDGTVLDSNGIKVPVLVTTLPIDTDGDVTDPAGGPLGLFNATSGVSYLIQGSTDLVTFDLDVLETFSLDFSAYPPAPDGFEYRAFQLSPGTPSGFLRVAVRVQ